MPGGRSAAAVSRPPSTSRPWLTAARSRTSSRAEDYAKIAAPPEGTDGRFAIAPFTVEGRWGVDRRGDPGGIDASATASSSCSEASRSQAKLALQSASSYETLERTFLSTVEALANALEANDEYTSSHARWITDLALKVGEELGLEPRELKRLELGALFHDIGKIGIPSTILTKPGPLTPRSARSSRRIRCSASGSSRRSSSSARCAGSCAACHERWDGKGYPERLAGDAIPLESRIIFACDAFHAMTTDRPYRRALERRRGAAPARGRRRHAVRSAGRRRAPPRPRRSSPASAAQPTRALGAAAGRGTPTTRRRRPSRSRAEREEHMRRVAGDEAAARLEQVGRRG